MPRLTAIEITEADPKAKTLLEGVEKKLGLAPNVMRTMANSPAVLEAYLGLGNALAKGSLGPKLREQIALTVAELNGCRYCLAAHSAVGRMVGLSDEEIADSRRSASPDRKIEAALRFARKVVTERGWVSDDDIAALRGVGASDGEIAEIVGAVALNTFSTYFNHVAGTEVDFPEVEAPGSKPACACG